MRLLVSGLLSLVLISCEMDNFDVVTKDIDAPDTIAINKEFYFRLTLRNDTDKRIKLTIDKDVLKSIQFLPDWTCDHNYVFHKVPNPVSVDNDYEVHYLNKNDSISYKFTGLLSSYNTDSLKFTIVDYDRIFRLKNERCKNFEMILGGMWLPGDFNPVDAMESNNFGKKIQIRE